MKALLDWLDHRTGCRKLVQTALYEHVPGGARWRYIWGSTLSFAIVVQFITGIFLWMNYSPSAQSAWESVYFLNQVTAGGWVLRGLHHFMAQLMVPLLVLHFVQVMIDGAYRAPREVNYWFGLGLLGLTLATSLTGYLLPWDQRGYWSTKVATNLLSGVPMIGGSLQRLVIGNANYGHQTLTRFFCMHAGVLPAAMVLLIIGHVALFRRHGLTVRLPKRGPDAMFWPDQVLKDAIACLVVLLGALALVVWFEGAELGAPANPAEPYSAARPDWYFMSLFQLLKYFEGERLIWGSLIIPGIVFLIFMLMPFLGRWRVGHFLNLFILFTGLAGFAALTAIAFIHDAHDPHYQAAVAQAKADAARVKFLAQKNKGIPNEGAAALLANDPRTQGPRLFASHCASCHTWNGRDGLGAPLKEPPTAADLGGFASRAWLRGFLDPQQIESLKFFGGTAFVHPKAGDKIGRMVRFVITDVASYTPEEKEQMEKIIAAISAEAELRAQKTSDARDAAVIAEGRKLIADDALTCVDCHQFHTDDPVRGPLLTGYGSRDWLLDFIKNPAHDHFYGKRNDRMPSFGKSSRLSTRELDLLVAWMRDE